MSPKKPTNQEKGDSLEEALKHIETLFLKSSNIDPSKITITQKYKLNDDGTDHEIDLYVEINHGHNYKVISIFECKNWKKKIGKELIPDFAKKVDIVNAHIGLFIARDFSSDAYGYVKKHFPKVKLLKFDTITEKDIKIQLSNNTITKATLYLFDESAHEKITTFNHDDFFVFNEKKVTLLSILKFFFNSYVDQIILEDPNELEFDLLHKCKLNIDTPDGAIALHNYPISKIEIEGYFIRRDPVIQAKGFQIDERGQYIEVEIQAPNISSHKFTITGIV